MATGQDISKICCCGAAMTYKPQLLLRNINFIKTIDTTSHSLWYSSIITFTAWNFVWLISVRSFPPSARFFFLMRPQRLRLALVDNSSGNIITEQKEYEMFLSLLFRCSGSKRVLCGIPSFKISVASQWGSRALTGVRALLFSFKAKRPEMCITMNVFVATELLLWLPKSIRLSFNPLKSEHY